MFETPFWIVLFENVEDGKYSVAREIIGTSEPTNTETRMFLEELDYNAILYTIPVEDGKTPDEKLSFKKRQKKAKKAVDKSNYKNTFSKAQEELKKQQELNKKTRKHISKEDKEKEKERKFELKQQKKKQKMKGH